jgi:hypothetical protein
MFAALLAYKAKHGDCNVPTIWPEDPRLITWVNNQRALRKRDKLEANRIRRLDEIGFR